MLITSDVSYELERDHQPTAGRKCLCVAPVEREAAVPDIEAGVESQPVRLDEPGRPRSEEVLHAGARVIHLPGLEGEIARRRAGLAVQLAQVAGPDFDEGACPSTRESVA